MLLELSVSDFAIIERTTLQFSDGMNVLTGETGAGKSILLDALGAVLGARVSSDLVRTGARSASVEAAFIPLDSTLERLQAVIADLGIEIVPGDAVVLSREILSGGRSTARINGKMMTASALQGVGSLLVDIHGQSDHLAILKPAEQLNLLDRFAGTWSDRARVGEHVRTWRETRRSLADIQTGARERAQRVDLLRYQIDEIDTIAPRPGEDLDLARERDVLRDADRLKQSAMSAYAVLAGDDDGLAGLLAGLRQVVGLVSEVGSVDAEAAPFVERANDALVLSEDLMRDLRDYAEAMESDEGRLQEVEDRIDALNGLRRKYGERIEQVLEFRDAAAWELAELESGTYDAEALERRLAELESDISLKAMKLHQTRTEAAAALSSRIEQAIADLNMGSAHVAIRISQRDDEHGISIDGTGRRVHVDETGIDQVEFLIAPNAGEALKPLARVASGGETARLMLAIKSILSEVDLTPTLVFDEIDVGVGGRSGQVVGEKLRAIAGDHQVIVVTHLPQIAAFAETHLKIEKRDAGGRTVSVVVPLEGAERETELAAMLDGTPVSAAALSNAREMILRASRMAS